MVRGGSEEDYRGVLKAIGLVEISMALDLRLSSQRTGKIHSVPSIISTCPEPTHIAYMSRTSGYKIHQITMIWNESRFSMVENLSWSTLSHESRWPEFVGGVEGQTQRIHDTNV